MLLAAVQKREEGRAWEMWLALYPLMIVPQPGEKQPRIKFQPFSTFLKKIQGPPLKADERTPEEIIAKFEGIRKRHQKKA